METYPKLGAAGTGGPDGEIGQLRDVARLAGIDVAGIPAQRPDPPRDRLASAGLRLALVAPFVAVVALAIGDALSAAVISYGGGQAAPPDSQLATGDLLAAIQYACLIAEVVALACSSLALAFGLTARRRARRRGSPAPDPAARLALALGAGELAIWLALGLWLLLTFGPFR
jgi:hypothetical protein